MRFFLIALLIVITPSFLLADNFKSKYVSLLNAGNYDKLIKHIQEWEKVKPKDPELYVAYFNYYINKQRVEGISIDKKKKPGSEISIVDPDTKKTVAYMNKSVSYNDDDLKQAFYYLDKGINLYPNRLDMHFGKIYVLGEIEDYQNLVFNILKVIKISKENKNKWLWSDNTPVKNAQSFMLDNIQSRVYDLVQLGDETSLKNAEIISQTLIDSYPKCIFGYSNIGVLYMSKNKFKEALEYLKKAEDIDPKDVIILNNIAYSYAQLNEKENSRIYYNKLIKYGSSDDKKYAKQKLNELGK